MAKCEICQKGAHFGNNVSHSHRRSNAVWKSNVKSVRVSVNEPTRRCTFVLPVYALAMLRELNFVTGMI